MVLNHQNNLFITIFKAIVAILLQVTRFERSHFDKYDQ